MAALDFGARELRRTNCTSRSLDLVRLATEKNLCALGVQSSGLIAHELFHILDPDLLLLNLSSESAKTISTIKSCLKDMHNKGSFYLTEDWADLGGALVTAESNTNSYCATIQKFGLSFSFNSIDTHSPSLFRLLHYQAYKKNGLPNSCQKILSRQVPPVLIQSCFGSR